MKRKKEKGKEKKGKRKKEKGKRKKEKGIWGRSGVRNFFTTSVPI